MVCNNHRGNCNRASFYAFFQKYYLCCLKCTPSHLKRLSHVNWKENKTVLLGLAFSKALGVYHQNKNPLFRERWIASTSRILGKIIHLQSYLAGCQVCELFCALQCWNHKAWSDHFSPTWPLFTVWANLPYWTCLQALLTFLMRILPPSCLWDIFTMLEWIQDRVEVMELGCQHSSA